jgi:hypothetical protein
MAATIHRCNERCVCPIHGTPLIYAPTLDDHACQDGDCVLGGGTVPIYNAEIRYVFIQARREHGHDELTDGCALCLAEYDEACTYAQGRYGPREHRYSGWR